MRLRRPHPGVQRDRREPHPVAHQLRHRPRRERPPRARHLRTARSVRRRQREHRPVRRQRPVPLRAGVPDGPPVLPQHPEDVPRHACPPQPLPVRAQRCLQHQPRAPDQPHLRVRSSLPARARGAASVGVPQLDRPPTVVTARGEVRHHARVPDPPADGRRRRGRSVHPQQVPGPQQPRQLHEGVVRHPRAPGHRQPDRVPVEPGPALLDRHPRRQLVRHPDGQGHRPPRSSAGAA